ncbi:hypothetical protein D1007_46346 [Hordeum vulgare]|nr:hypothetical protein D1007_46346 [Hordeum vulgare]
MDDDLDATAGLASLASSGMTTAPSGKGKPRAPRKTAAVPKPKKTLTPEQHARELPKRKGRRHATGARDESIATDAVAAAAQQEVTNVRVATATREALYMLGLTPSQHGLVNVVVAAASTGSSVFPWMVLPDSPRASAFRCSASTSIRRPPASLGCAAPSTPAPAPAPIDLNATSIAGDSSSGGARKRARQMPVDVMPAAHNVYASAGMRHDR